MILPDPPAPDLDAPASPIPQSSAQPADDNPMPRIRLFRRSKR